MSSPAGAASGAGDAGQSQGDGGEAQTNGGPDVGALTETLSSMQASQEEMRQYLASNPWAQQAPADEAAAEPDPLDLGFLDQAGYDQETATQLADVFETQMQQRLDAQSKQFDARLEKQDARITEREQMEQMRDLVERFPEMAESEVNQAIFRQAHALVDAHDASKELANAPWFWGLVYQAQTAQNAAQDEGSEQPSAAHLEGGAGAGPAASRSPGDDYLDALKPRGGERGLFD